tara:strand:- start:494 stop:715 length:222 start_codon:yes stop_codon:yes gene_type:complete
MKELKIHNTIAYLILRRLPLFKFENGNVLNRDRIKAVSDWVGSDHVLKEQNYLLFCETIQDVEFEDINDGETE